MGNQWVGQWGGGAESGFDLFAISEISEKSRSECEGRIRARCQTAYFGMGRALCRVLGRYKMFVDTNDRDMVPHLMFDGFWEIWVTEALCDLIKPGMVVADIGANHGYFSVLMSELVGPDGFVHSFEPNPRLAQLVEHSLAINGYAARSAVHNVALAETDGAQMALIIPPQQESKAHIEPITDDLPDHATILRTRRLDSEDSWSQIELAKIDVEGAEQLLWAGAKGLLDNGRLKTVLLEFTTARYDDPNAFLDQLMAPGFTLSLIDHRNGVVPITRDELFARSHYEDMMLALCR